MTVLVLSEGAMRRRSSLLDTRLFFGSSPAPDFDLLFLRHFDCQQVAINLVSVHLSRLERYAPTLDFARVKKVAGQFEKREEFRVSLTRSGGITSLHPTSFLSATPVGAVAGLIDDWPSSSFLPSSAPRSSSITPRLTVAIFYNEK